ncbi:asparagine synthase (glutamine-hydrolyzing) [Owenweeksia hongkongensis]|uniref:asparagine synthase (glutamine-hydrolyzing) n=1 Tax=Owenweeksia hongkongensis TaxID=253245 RepID=UPI003A8CDD61
MCAIVGCKLYRSLQEGDLRLLRKMRDDMTYRGPDDFGEYFSISDGVYLGHRRLSIVDLHDRSRQPMRRDQLVLSFNGEIYNHKALRSELGNEGFLTCSDTEVILRAWQDWGERCLDRFDGMFAFALYDGEYVHLVTDPFGEKPLYVYHASDGVYFSSEAQPLVDAFDLEFSLNDTELAEYLSLGYILPPATGYKSLTSVPPASICRLGPEGVVPPKKYWAIPEFSSVKGEVYPVDPRSKKRIKNILCESLERRLDCDVAKGLFLSGGVDSCLLASLASKELGQKIETYTVAFPDGGDEVGVAAEVAKVLQLPHTVIDSTESSLWRELPKSLSSFYCCPNDNATVLAVYQMCEGVRKHMRVALTGLGGDELFAGYQRYKLFDRLRGYYKYSKYVYHIANILRNVSSKMYLVSTLMGGGKNDQYLAVKNNGFNDLLRKAVPSLPQNLFPETTDELINDVRRFDILSSMPQSYIPAVERGSMRASVEVRAPFLSRDLMSEVALLDQRALIRFGPKNVLKSILSEYLDLENLQKGKQGFIFPLQRYYQQPHLVRSKLSGTPESTYRDLWERRESLKSYTLLNRLSILAELYANKGN